LAKSNPLSDRKEVLKQMLISSPNNEEFKLSDCDLSKYQTEMSKTVKRFWDRNENAKNFYEQICKRK